MSLVGSLEDLGLGDILQIVSLARKSGLLLLHSSGRRGRIVLLDGQVRAASVDAEGGSLRAILVDGGFVEAEAFKRAEQAAAARCQPLEEAVLECTELGRERLEALRREQVEQAVLTLFGWRSGEFSFEVRERVEEPDADLLLPHGINAQYLAMEATRLGDEGAETDPSADPAGLPADEEPLFSGEEASDEEAAPVAAGPPVADPEPVEPAPAPEPSDPEATLSAGVPAPPPATPAAEPERAPPRRALIALDRELAPLEWTKGQLAGVFERVHILQSAELAVARVRQYLSRGQCPVVLLGAAALPESERAAFVRRLRGLAPRMPLLWLHEQGGGSVPDDLDGSCFRPTAAELGGGSAFESEGRVLREALAGWAHSESHATAAPTPATVPPGVSLERLRAVSERLRGPATRGDVLSLVLDFASETFSRVAIFMVRDGSAIGIAQRGLARAGGPDDAVLRHVEIPVDEPHWFRAPLAERRAERSPPEGDPDRRLAELLGDRQPRLAYVAPIESGGEVAALLYADNLPDESAVGDTAALEIVLHEAGMALDRALLERALAEADPPSGAGD